MSKPLHEILERPVVTEKSVRMSQHNRYTFRCKTTANKIEIRQAIETVYGVQVSAVNTLTVKGKARRAGKARPGKTVDWKKAIVTLPADEKAPRLKEIFEGA